MKSRLARFIGSTKRKRIVNMAIAILSILAIIIVLITIYGQNVGNFVVAVETEMQTSISLSETLDFSSAKARLAAPGVKGQIDATYTDIPKDMHQREGSQNDIERKRYLAYNFYLKNTSYSAVDYSALISLNKSTNGSDSALRVMVIRNGEEVVYAKAKEYPESERGKPEDHFGTPIFGIYSTVPFLSSLTVMQSQRLNMQKDEIDKYTVVLWLEGWDRECTDEIKGAILRLEMKFTAVSRV